MRRVILAVIGLLMWVSVAVAEDMKMAVTTSFHNSGLSDVLLPAISEDLKLDVHLLVVGTGQALRLGEAGDVDAILVHSRQAEEDFLQAGHGTHRREIMYNDFVIIGPSSDPANIADASDAKGALKRISDNELPFVSRGDDSGTHKKEIGLWSSANLNVDEFANWYRAVGSGMGAALNTASGMNAYILADRASWLNFKNKGDLALLFSGDPVLFNQYAYIPVNPNKHAQIKNDLAIELENWLVSKRAEDLINTYNIDGQPLFVFNATR